MEAKTLSIFEALKFGFVKTIDNFSTFFLALLTRFAILIGGYSFVGFILGGGLMPIRMLLFDRNIYTVTKSFSAVIVGFIIVGLLLMEIVDAWLCLGLLKMSFDIVDKGHTKFKVLFSQRSLIVSYLVLMLLLKLIVGVGYVLFIVPGIIWSVQLCLAYQLMLDTKASPIRALTQSSQLTKGFRMDLLGLYFLVWFIQIIGIGIFGVGFFVTLPITNLTYTWIYRHIQ